MANVARYCCCDTAEPSGSPCNNQSVTPPLEVGCGVTQTDTCNFDLPTCTTQNNMPFVSFTNLSGYCVWEWYKGGGVSDPFARVKVLYAKSTGTYLGLSMTAGDYGLVCQSWDGDPSPGATSNGSGIVTGIACYVDGGISGTDTVSMTGGSCNGTATVSIT